MHSTIIEYNILRQEYPNELALLILNARSKIRMLNYKKAVNEPFTDRDSVLYEEYLEFLSSVGASL